MMTAAQARRIEALAQAGEAVVSATVVRAPRPTSAAAGHAAGGLAAGASAPSTACASTR